MYQFLKTKLFFFKSLFFVSFKYETKDCYLY